MKAQKPKYTQIDNESSFKEVYKSPFLGAVDFNSNDDTIVVLQKAFAAVGTFEGGRESKVVFGVLKGYESEIVINATNSKQIAKFTNSIYPKDWTNVPLQIFIDNKVKSMGGEIVDGWRIRAKQPKLTKPEMNPTHKKWEGMIKSLAEGNTSIESILKHYDMSKENQILAAEQVQKLTQTGEVDENA